MGAEQSQGPGWWLASDGEWYPPELHPQASVRRSLARVAEPVTAPAMVDQLSVGADDEAPRSGSSTWLKLILAMSLLVNAIVAGQQIVSRTELFKPPSLVRVAERRLTDTNSTWRAYRDSLSIVIEDDQAREMALSLERLLDDLGFSSAVMDRMGTTRALDGTQSAEGDGYNVSWTYHPDDGLQMIFERE